MIPAFEIEIDCCSIASWIDVRSASFILSNSSIRQTPLSASTSAPPSSVHSRVTESLWTDAVNPTAEAPWPVVYTARGEVFSTYLRNCDLAVPGSPSNRTLMSPRRRCLPLTFLLQPPNIESATAVLMSEVAEDRRRDRGDDLLLDLVIEGDGGDGGMGGR